MHSMQIPSQGAAWRRQTTATEHNAVDPLTTRYRRGKCSFCPRSVFGSQAARTRDMRFAQTSGAAAAIVLVLLLVIELIAYRHAASPTGNKISKRRFTAQWAPDGAEAVSRASNRQPPRRQHPASQRPRQPPLAPESSDSVGDAVIRGAARRLEEAMITGVVPRDKPGDWPRRPLVPPASRQALPVRWPPSAVTCTGELSHRTWRKTCVYENLYFINSTYVYAVGAEAPAMSDETFRAAYLVMSQDRPLGNTNSKGPYTFLPTRVPLDVVKKLLSRQRGAVMNVNGTSVLHDRFYFANPGHHVWNDMHAMFTALSDVGFGDVSVTPVTLSVTHRPIDSARAASELRFFGGPALLNTRQWKEEGRAVFLRQVVVGTGQGGADDVQQLRRLLAGRAFTRHAFWQFRGRMMRRHGIEPGPFRRTSTDHRDPSRPLKVVVVQNKRADLHIEDITECLQQEAGRGRQIVVEAIRWGDKRYTGGVSGLPGLLRTLSNADVYVSGVGTGMMWAPFIASGGVVINLEWILGLSAVPAPQGQKKKTPRHVVSALHSLDHMMTDHVRVLYYDPAERWDGVNIARVRGMVADAVAIIRGGFSLPVPILDNADATGAAFLDYCLSNITVCTRILRSATADRAANCAWRRYMDYIFYQDRCWVDDPQSWTKPRPPSDSNGARFAGMDQPDVLAHHKALLEKLQAVPMYRDNWQPPESSRGGTCYP